MRSCRRTPRPHWQPSRTPGNRQGVCLPDVFSNAAIASSVAGGRRFRFSINRSMSVSQDASHETIPPVRNRGVLLRRQRNLIGQIGQASAELHRLNLMYLLAGQRWVRLVDGSVGGIGCIPCRLIYLPFDKPERPLRFRHAFRVAGPVAYGVIDPSRLGLRIPWTLNGTGLRPCTSRQARSPY